ncbi:MAG: DUF4157 domain-containing protein [Methylococcaceae bacterium]
MTQKLVTESPEKTKQDVERREPNPAFAQLFQGKLHPVAQLQRTLGNRNVAQLIQARQLTPGGKIIGLQRKLTVGAADDQYEQEADQVARQVMNTSDAVAAASAQRAPLLAGTQDPALQTKPLTSSITPVVQRQRGKESEVEEDKDKEEEKNEFLQAKSFSKSAALPLQRQIATEDEEVEPVQAKSAGALSDTFEAGADVETQVSLSKGRGSPLPDPVRAYMEPRFGVDFSHVHVHTGSDALQMNQAVGAQAFTHGSDIYFGEGRSPNNLELTAHELTHVVQQTGGAPLQTNRLDEVSSANTDPSIQRSNAVHGVGKEEKKFDLISSDPIPHGGTPGVLLRDAVTHQVVRRDLDQKMAEDARTAGAAPDAATNLVASRTVLADLSAAKRLADEVESYSDGVKKAEQNHKDAYGGSLAVNANTKFQLQLLATNLQETDRNLGDFQTMYAACRTDYTRLLAMTNVIAGAQRGGRPDEHAFETVAKDFKPGMLKPQVDDLNQNDKMFHTIMTEWKDSRKNVNTIATKLIHEQGESSAKLNSMLKITYLLQGIKAKEESDEAKAALEKVKKEIAAVVDGIMLAVSLAGRLNAAIAAAQSSAPDPFTGTVIPKIQEGEPGSTYIPKNIGDPAKRAALKDLGQMPGDPSVQPAKPGEDYIPKNLGDPSRREARKEVGDIPDRTERDAGADARKSLGAAAGHLKGTDSGGALPTDPKQILQKLGDAAEGKKIAGLEAEIQAADKVAGLANAQSQVAELKAAQAEWKTALLKVSDLVNGLLEAQKEHRRKTDEFAKYAKGRNQKIAVAIRIIGEADTFIAKADAAIMFGENQQASGTEAMSQRTKISNSSDPTNPEGGNLQYYKPYQFTTTTWYGSKLTDHRLQKVFVELPGDSSGLGGFANTQGGSLTIVGKLGAQNVTGIALEELKGQRKQIFDLRGIIQNSIDIGGPGINAAL